MLDCDSIPMRDPAYLLEDPAFQTLGNMFWPDMSGGWVKGPVYDMLGLDEVKTKVRLAAGLNPEHGNLTGTCFGCTWRAVWWRDRHGA